MDGDRIADLDQVEATMTYLVANGETPFAYQYVPPPGMPQRSGRYAEHAVTVRNARPLAGELSLDRQGFILTDHDSLVRDFYDEALVKTVHYPEVERLVRKHIGASRVVVFDHNVRSGSATTRAATGVREPVHRVHNDYTAKSGPQRVRDLLPREAETLLLHRFAIVNVWRSIGWPVQDTPLGLCDARSMAPRDLVATELRYPDRTGETYSVAHNPAHRWYYFPRLRRDEAILLKCFDSATDGRARLSAHSAFADSGVPAGTPPRESIEVRTLAFFAPNA
ncbi:MAG: CmcJ/NvfI family oxidoreductase [Dongiaceae bacterium]